MEAVASLDRVAFVLVRDGERSLLIHGEGRMPLDGEDAAGLLARYDDPAILVPQLERLNSFDRSGEMVIFGAHREDRQVNFERQVGGHGSVGGEQVKPFLLARKEWGIDTTHVRGADDLYPLLRDLRDRIASGSN
jgi:hypothetical protein